MYIAVGLSKNKQKTKEYKEGELSAIKSDFLLWCKEHNFLIGRLICNRTKKDIQIV